MAGRLQFRQNLQECENDLEEHRRQFVELQETHGQALEAIQLEHQTQQRSLREKDQEIEIIENDLDVCTRQYREYQESSRQDIEGVEQELQNQSQLVLEKEGEIELLREELQAVDHPEYTQAEYEIQIEEKEEEIGRCETNRDDLLRNPDIGSRLLAL